MIIVMNYNVTELMFILRYEIGPCFIGLTESYENLFQEYFKR